MARRMSVTLKEYRFFRSFSTKIENWPMRKAEALWRKMRERKIAGMLSIKLEEKKQPRMMSVYSFQVLERQRKNHHMHSYRTIALMPD